LVGVSVVRTERVEEGVDLVTLDRPDSLNAMNHELVAAIHDALDAADADHSCRVVVLTGAGRAFCAGLDLEGPGSAPGTDGVGRAQTGMLSQQHIATLVTHMRAVRKPIIAAVNGAAAGGGLALALASDVRVASESARFNVAFVRIGLSGCDVGVSYLLPRLVGASRAFELMLTGRFVGAEEAERIGLVSRVVPDGEVVDAALETAAQIAANSPFGVWMTKEVMWSNLEAGSLQAAIDLENRTQILTTFTEDMPEAMRAFLEKRAPQFRNA
jgi:enoyl-CoA hydratase